MYVRFLNNAGIFHLLKGFLLLGDFVWFGYVDGHFFDGLREFSSARFREHAHTERKQETTNTEDSPRSPGNVVALELKKQMP